MYQTPSSAKSCCGMVEHRRRPRRAGPRRRSPRAASAAASASAVASSTSRTPALASSPSRCTTPPSTATPCSSRSAGQRDAALGEVRVVQAPLQRREARAPPARSSSPAPWCRPRAAGAAGARRAGAPSTRRRRRRHRLVRPARRVRIDAPVLPVALERRRRGRPRREQDRRARESRRARRRSRRTWRPLRRACRRRATRRTCRPRPPRSRSRKSEVARIAWTHSSSGCSVWSGGKRREQLGVVVEHLLEVRHQPAVVDGIACDSAAGLVEDAAAQHRAHLLLGRIQRPFVACEAAVGNQEVGHRCLRELGRPAEAAMHVVDAAAGSSSAERCRSAAPGSSASGGANMARKYSTALSAVASAT